MPVTFDGKPCQEESERVTTFAGRSSVACVEQRNFQRLRHAAQLLSLIAAPDTYLPVEKFRVRSFKHHRQPRDLLDFFGQIISYGGDFGGSACMLLRLPGSTSGSPCEWCTEVRYRLPPAGSLPLWSPAGNQSHQNVGTSPQHRWRQGERPRWVSVARPGRAPPGWQARVCSNTPTWGLVNPAGPPPEPCNCPYLVAHLDKASTRPPPLTSRAGRVQQEESRG
jgi:hypothetical protein